MITQLGITKTYTTVDWWLFNSFKHKRFTIGVERIHIIKYGFYKITIQ